MKVSVQDITDTEIVKDVELGDIMYLLVLFSFSSVRKGFGMSQTGDFLRPTTRHLHYILQLIQWVIFE